MAAARTAQAKRVAACVAAALLIATLAGCDRTGRPPGAIQVDFETSPPSTDPRLATDAASSRLNELIFDSLMKIDRNGEFVGNLAERVERPTPTEIIYHLRRGVRFSDGRELTARDVKYTYDSIENPDLRSPKRASLQELKAIEAPDDYTVVMTTEKPYAPALEMAAQGVVPYGTPPPLRSAAVAPSGSGPFMISSFTRDEMIRLERNPFHESAPGSPAAIAIKIVPDATVRALELAEGVCDFSGNNLEPDVLPWLGAHPFLTISNTPGSTYKYLSFNFRDPRLRDIRVRRAIVYAIDRATIVKSMLRGSARVASGLLAPESWAYEGAVTTYPYDPDRSRHLLDEAGYPVGADGMRALQIEFKTTPEGARQAEVFQAMLRRVGIALNVRTLEFTTYYADIQAGKFDMTSLQWVGINDPNHYYMIFGSTQTPPGMNRGYYSNPALDRLLEAGKRTIDLDQRRKIYAQVQRLVADDLPYVSLWWVDNVAVMNRRLADFQPYPNGSLRSLATLTLTGPDGAEPSR